MHHLPPQQAHDEVLRLRAHRLPPEGLPSAAILDSWVRSLQAGLDPAAPLTVPVVGAAELAQRRAQAGDVRRLAQAELATLAQQIAGSNFLLAFADHDGVILDLIADNRFATSSSSAGIVAGSRWHESVCGTNGLGTALATGAPVAVNGLAHHNLQLADITCTAAPVRDSQGRIVGVLDASSYYDSRQHHTHALVQMAATQIENGLLLHQMRRHTVLAVHPRSEYLGTLSAGLLALDGQGLLQACNARAAQMLAGLQAVPGTAFEALFGVSFDAVLGDLPPGAELRLRDPLGRPLAAQVRARPHRPAVPSAP
ncbi:MAG: GAF domain-containing protein, partial [Aquabacterium sp.]|nr:GAF domain-containing protein [Aquabacterium sp.]